MRFAICNGLRQEAAPGLRGICSGCGSETIAKCGPKVMAHWAHKSRKPCDPWWENETEWHRAWKAHFPVEWQEVAFVDPDTHERHIADVYTDVGIAIEFQHSPISLDEIAARERFYGKMIWVIDGQRPSWLSIFKRNLWHPQAGDEQIYKLVWPGRANMLKDWPLNDTPVFIDFGAEKVWRVLERRVWHTWSMFILEPVAKAVLIHEHGGGRT